MIPGSFDYFRPQSVAEASALLAKDDNARVLAGGHSLLPMMKLRMAQPSALIDLGGIGELRQIQFQGGQLHLGAMASQHDLLASDLVSEHAPILKEVALLIADPQVRYLGTIGGNVANGDPGNDMPAVMMALDAAFVLEGQHGRRNVKARAFYTGTYETALLPGEILTAVEIPSQVKGGFAYEKLKRKVGDYATAAAAVILSVKAGVVDACEITLTNLGPTALRAEAAASALIGKPAGHPGAIDAAVAAARAIMTPAHDTRGTPEYRTSAGGSMVRRAIQRALAKA
ncbi:xanthine dehydrogenase family protein subunit M [Aestuariivirga sp.]|uniref:FAD binding domain-containing protein n=1 Tax=Aestuariivirga sp. TaxID=2650926 RepID=UPI0030191128